MGIKAAHLAGAICAALVLTVLCGVAIHVNKVSGWTIPEWVTWHDREYAADLDGDGAFETLSLNNRNVSVYEDGTLVCTLPDQWLTSDVCIYDIDGDGRQEVITLTWKRGSFGYARPFWIEEDTQAFTQHVFIFNFEHDKLSHTWLSSDVRIDIADITIDSYGRLHLADPEGGEEVCEWQEWGLTYLSDTTPSLREEAVSSATLLFAGDAIIHEGMLRNVQGMQNADAVKAFEASYDSVSKRIEAADLAVVNQEAPLVEDAHEAQGAFPTFRAPKASAQALAEAGFDVFALANNHIADAGAEGIAATVDMLTGEDIGVEVVGVNPPARNRNEPSIFEVNGISIGIANYTYGLNGHEEDAPQEAGDMRALVNVIDDHQALIEEIRALDEQTDFTVCYLHVGEEYAKAPDEEVETLVREVVSAGADLVVCGHAHVVQRTETITVEGGNTATVCYGLGNLISNSPYAETALGALLEVVIEKPKDQQATSETYIGPSRLSSSANTSEGLATEREQSAPVSSEPTDNAVSDTAQIAACRVIPTVCHFGEGATEVMLLEQYSDEMSAKHLLNYHEPGSLSLASLLEQWRKTFSMREE